VQYGDEVYAVIDFRAVNARGEGDFYAGLAPTCPAADDLTRELGDRKEASLAAARHYIRFGRCPAAPGNHRAARSHAFRRTGGIPWSHDVSPYEPGLVPVLGAC
jgi:hypothetical protein